MSVPRRLLRAMLDVRLDDRQRAWLDEREAELAGGVDGARFATLVSLASRFAPRGALAPTADERGHAEGALPGWNPERWTTLEAARVALVLAVPDPEDDAFPALLEEAFRYADEGELCALYRSLQFLPDGGRFAWRAGEGCRTNMRSVFEAVACDSAYPVRELDDVAWRQLCVKALFVEAPLWRVHGLDGRIDAELTRMCLDLADERRSAGRTVYPELFLCLLDLGGDRASASIEREVSGGDPASTEASRRGAVLALGRRGETARLEELASGSDAVLADAARAALAGHHDQTAFAALREDEHARI